MVAESLVIFSSNKIRQTDEGAWEHLVDSEHITVLDKIARYGSPSDCGFYSGSSGRL